jgi:hypothetical protein
MPEVVMKASASLALIPKSVLPAGAKCVKMNIGAKALLPPFRPALFASQLARP